MGESKNIIEINGKRYDARTGSVVGHSKNSPKKPSGIVMDGVVRKAHPAVPTPKKPVVARSKAQTAHAHHKKTKRSSTLMRKGLKKPAATHKKPEITPSIGSNVHARIERARAVVQSKKISRFSEVKSFTKTVAPVAVAHPKNEKATAARKKAAAQSGAPTIQHFEQAMQNATSHLTKYSEKKTKRLFKNKKINAVAGSLAVLLLVGFFGWQNAPNLKMRLAAADSGVSAAHLPAYKPAGFGMTGPIKTEPGKVTVSFKSRTDDRNFTISQAASNWNSESLYNNELASKPNKQTWNEQGKTVYIYDDTSATWVDAGVWYKIEGNAELTTDQLLRIVNSF